MYANLKNLTEDAKKITSLPWKLSSAGTSVTVESTAIDSDSRSILEAMVMVGAATFRPHWDDKQQGQYIVERPKFHNSLASDLWSAVGRPRADALESSIRSAIHGIPLHGKVGGLGGVGINGSFFVLTGNLTEAKVSALRDIASTEEAAVNEVTRGAPQRFEFGTYRRGFKQSAALVEVVAEQEFNRLQKEAADFLNRFHWRLEREDYKTVLIANQYSRESSGEISPEDIERLNQIARLYCVKDFCTVSDGEVRLKLPVPGDRDKYWDEGNFSGVDGYATSVCERIAKQFEARVNLILQTGGDWNVELNESNTAVRLTKLLSESSEFPKDPTERARGREVMRALGSLIGGYAYFNSAGHRDAGGVGVELESFDTQQIPGTAQDIYHRCQVAVEESANTAIKKAGAHLVVFKSIVGDPLEEGYRFDGDSYDGPRVTGTKGTFAISGRGLANRPLYLAATEVQRQGIDQLATELRDQIKALPWKLIGLDDRYLRYSLELPDSVRVDPVHSDVINKFLQYGVIGEKSLDLQTHGSSTLEKVLKEVHSNLVELEVAAIRSLNWRNDGYQMSAEIPGDWKPGEYWSQNPIQDGKITIDVGALTSGFEPNHPLVGAIKGIAESVPEKRRQGNLAEVKNCEDAIVALPWNVAGRTTLELDPSVLGSGFKDALRLLARYYELSGLDQAISYRIISDRVNPERQPSVLDIPEYAFHLAEAPEVELLAIKPLSARLLGRINAEVERAMEEIVMLPWYKQSDGSFILHHGAISEAQKDRIVAFIPYDERNEIAVLSEGRHQDKAFLVARNDTDGALYGRLLERSKTHVQFPGPLSLAQISRV